MREIADTLGIDAETGHRRVFNTLAGSLTAYGHTVSLTTLGLEFDSVVYFAGDYGLPRNLLGSEGWLRKVRFAVVDYDGFPPVHAVKNKLVKTRGFSLYGFGAEGFVKRALGGFKNRFGLLTSDGREACQKIFERMTTLEIIKQAFDGNASSVEAWGVAGRVRIDPDDTV